MLKVVRIYPRTPGISEAQDLAAPPKSSEPEYQVQLALETVPWNGSRLVVFIPDDCGAARRCFFNGGSVEGTLITESGSISATLDVTQDGQAGRVVLEPPTQATT